MAFRRPSSTPRASTRPTASWPTTTPPASPRTRRGSGVMEINVIGVANMIQAVAKPMAENGGGASSSCPQPRTRIRFLRRRALHREQMGRPGLLFTARPQLAAHGIVISEYAPGEAYTPLVEKRPVRHPPSIAPRDPDRRLRRDPLLHGLAAHNMSVIQLPVYQPFGGMPRRSRHVAGGTGDPAEVSEPSKRDTDGRHSCRPSIRAGRQECRPSLSSPPRPDKLLFRQDAVAVRVKSRETPSAFLLVGETMQVFLQRHPSVSIGILLFEHRLAVRFWICGCGRRALRLRHGLASRIQRQTRGHHGIRAGLGGKAFTQARAFSLSDFTTSGCFAARSVLSPGSLGM